jgi:hypothetical protein
MDYLYILFAIPVAAFTIAGYSKLIADIRGINQGRPLIAIRILSGSVLALIALELALVFTVGKVEARFLTIPIIVDTRVALFFLGVPSLANLFVLGKEYGPERWKYSLVPCTFLAFVLLIMQLFETDLLDGV